MDFIVAPLAAELAPSVPKSPRSDVCVCVCVVFAYGGCRGDVGQTFLSVRISRSPGEHTAGREANLQAVQLH